MRHIPRHLVVAMGLAVAAATFAVGPPATAATGVARDPADPAYVVRLTGGAQGHTWVGRETVSFTNLRAADLTEIWLRLWSNGVMGCGGVDGHDAIRVSRVRGGVPDAPTVDCTALLIQLDTPVPQGGRGSVSLHVAIEVPARNDRFGYHRGLALMGTALPTLAVRDDAGWHSAEPFVDLGESFYSIAGNYRVTLNTPTGLDTPATGIRVARASGGPGRVVTTYAAARVRDFAWAAGRLAAVTGRVGHARLVVSYQPSGLSRRGARAALADAEGSMRAYGVAFGRYPYRELDVVLTAFGTFGGMEYPTIVFANPSAVEHEVAHQWWYGIVGDDEFHEPWLDEGFATWVQRLAPGSRPWRNCARPDWPGAGGLNSDMSYWAAHAGSYGAVVYYGGGCLLANLAHRFGLKPFIGVLRAYAAAHRFGVSRTSEFRQAVEDAAAADGVAGIGPAYWSAWRVD